MSSPIPTVEYSEMDFEEEITFEDDFDRHEEAGLVYVGKEGSLDMWVGTKEQWNNYDERN